MMGFSREEMLKLSVPDIDPVNDHEKFSKTFRSLVGSPPATFETAHRRKDGSMLPVEVTVSIIRIREEFFALSLVRNITERNQSADFLRESERRYRSLFENTLNGVAYCKIIYSSGQPQDFVYLDINSSFEKLTGLKDVRGKQATEIIPGIYESNSELLEIYGRVALTGKPEKFETHIKDLGGWFSVSVYSPEPEYFVTVFENITERKRAEESMLKLAAIEERQRLGRDLHDSVAQSIHSLVLFAETLTNILEKGKIKRSLEISERLQESARQALKETRLMLYELQPSVPEAEVDLLRGLEKRLSMVERRAGIRANVVLDGTVEEYPPEWNKELFWITIEALNNSLKHAQARNVKINIRCRPQRVELEIVDDGIGVDPARTRAGGMGLRSMSERAALLGGELTVLSNPGEGTCIRFCADIKE
jgi:PAS domain S-box-containing protein